MTTRRRDAGPRKDEASGRWYFVVDLPPGPNGERRQAKRRGFATRKAAQEAIDDLRVSARSGAYVPPARQTLAAFVNEEWLPALAATVEPSTAESYARNLRLHVLPSLGGVRLQALEGPQLNVLYAQLRESGRKDGKGGLSARSVRYTHTIVHAALDDAVRWGRVVANAADRADPPSAKQAKAPEMTVWSQAELRAFLDGTEGERNHAAWTFLATSACRRGEALGIRWSDLDLDATPATASIRQQVTVVGHSVVTKPRTKGDKPRTIELDARTVAVLRSWRARQAQERLLVGAGYRDNGLVFCRPDGEPHHPEKFTREFSRRLARAPFAGLPKIRLHDLRHTWATLALVAGVDVKIVSERLGHASPVVTWQTYQHVIRGMQTDAAERVAALVFG